MKGSAHILILSILTFFLGIQYLTTEAPAVLSATTQNLSVFEKYLPNFTKSVRLARFEALKENLDELQGSYAFYFYNPLTGEKLTHNESDLFYAASMYKTPIALATYKEIEAGLIAEDKELTYTSFDASGGTGIINISAPGSKYTVKYVVERLLKDSDNTAQNMLLRTLNPETVQESFSLADSKGEYYRNNVANVNTAAKVFENLLFSDYISDEHKSYLINVMTSTSFDDRIHSGLREDLVFSHKIGSWGETGSWHDCGIVTDGSKKAVVCLMSRSTTYSDFLEGSRLVGEFVNLFF